MAFVFVNMNNILAQICWVPEIKVFSFSLVFCANVNLQKIMIVLRWNSLLPPLEFILVIFVSDLKCFLSQLSHLLLHPFIIRKFLSPFFKSSSEHFAHINVEMVLNCRRKSLLPISDSSKVCTSGCMIEKIIFTNKVYPRCWPDRYLYMLWHLSGQETGGPVGIFISSPTCTGRAGSFGYAL